ncbi:hypothetical protein MVEN_00690200 [Mycena venus]|uniref:Uncharacterized protein n=1 Tax=Mycena venus TaxID=2733690 RepID=A0A8H6YJX3_9AGAR|nr:hypothetical protein MVEN_00690200 [Mycena venus]
MPWRVTDCLRLTEILPFSPGEQQQLALHSAPQQATGEDLARWRTQRSTKCRSRASASAYASGPERVDVQRISGLQSSTSSSHVLCPYHAPPARRSIPSPHRLRFPCARYEECERTFSPPFIGGTLPAPS